MRRLLTAGVGAGLLLGLLVPSVAEAAPAVHAKPASAQLLRSAKGDAADRAQLHDAIERGVQQVYLAQGQYNKPSQVKLKTGIAWITLNVSGSSWDNFTVEGTMHFVFPTHLSTADHRAFFNTRTGRYVYNF